MATSAETATATATAWDYNNCTTTTTTGGYCQLLQTQESIFLYFQPHHHLPFVCGNRNWSQFKSNANSDFDLEAKLKSKFLLCDFVLFLVFVNFMPFIVVRVYRIFNFNYPMYSCLFVSCKQKLPPDNCLDIATVCATSAAFALLRLLLRLLFFDFVVIFIWKF